MKNGVKKCVLTVLALVEESENPSRILNLLFDSVCTFYLVSYCHMNLISIYYIKRQMTSARDICIIKQFHCHNIFD